jgi:hypothetical protein
MFRRMILASYLKKLALSVFVNGLIALIGYGFYSLNLLIFSTVVWTYTIVNFIAYMGPLTFYLVRILRSPIAKMLDKTAAMFKQAGIPIEFQTLNGNALITSLDSGNDEEQADDDKPTVH